MKGVYTKYKSLKLFYNFLNRKDIREKIEYAKNNRENVDEIIDYIKEEYEKFRPDHDFFNDLIEHIDYFWRYFFLSNKGESKLRDIKNSLPIGVKITQEDPYGEEDWDDVDEKWNPFKKDVLVPYDPGSIDPYGEEDWNDDDQKKIKYIKENIYHVYERSYGDYIDKKILLKKDDDYIYIGKSTYHLIKLIMCGFL